MAVRITIELPNDIEQRLRDMAAASGQDVEEYLIAIARREASNTSGRKTDSFEEDMKTMAEIGANAHPWPQSLFSRSAIYEHEERD